LILWWVGGLRRRRWRWRYSGCSSGAAAEAATTEDMQPRITMPVDEFVAPTCPRWDGAAPTQSLTAAQGLKAGLARTGAPLGPTKDCAVLSVTRTGSSTGFERGGSARMATSSGRRKPRSGAHVCGGKRWRRVRRRAWTSLAPPRPDQKAARLSL